MDQGRRVGGGDGRRWGGGGEEDGWERGANTMGRESQRGEKGVTEGEGQRDEDFVKKRKGKKMSVKLRNVRF